MSIKKGQEVGKAKMTLRNKFEGCIEQNIDNRTKKNKIKYVGVFLWDEWTEKKNKGKHRRQYSQYQGGVSKKSEE